MSNVRELHPAFDQLEGVERDQLVATLQRLRDTLPATVQKPRKKRGN